MEHFYSSVGHAAREARCRSVAQRRLSDEDIYRKLKYSRKGLRAYFRDLAARRRAD
jgi:hypothetical protein